LTFDFLRLGRLCLPDLAKEAFDDARKADAEATARYFDEIKRAIATIR
jgi:hypothetical protein